MYYWAIPGRCALLLFSLSTNNEKETSSILTYTNAIYS